MMLLKGEWTHPAVADFMLVTGQFVPSPTDLSHNVFIQHALKEVRGVRIFHFRSLYIAEKISERIVKNTDRSEIIIRSLKCT